MEYFLFIVMGLVFVAVLMAFVYGRDFKQHQRIDDLRKENILLEQSAKTQLASLEEDRARIARDLHDDMAQLLSGVRLTLQNFRLEPSLSERSKALLLRMDRDLTDLLNRVQDIIWNLAPQLLEEKGLTHAIWKMCDQLKELRAFHVHFSQVGSDQRLTTEIELQLFRIAQEMISNALKHSNGWNIYVRVHWNESELLITIHDDGVSKSEVKKERTLGGRGLSGIQLRAKLIGAEIKTRKVDKGTSYEVTYPLTKK
ncbi:MAG: histidine kinase [Chryseolinea sp.]